MVAPRRPKGPFPDPNFPEIVNEVNMPPFMDSLSGEQTASVKDRILGVSRFAGRVSDVHLACSHSGKDDDEDLYFEGDVKINGTTIFTTKPKLAHVSGEASAYKTSLAEAGDTGITQPVLAAANNFNAGDILTWEFLLERTASPTTEMANPCIVVELSPDF